MGGRGIDFYLQANIFQAMTRYHWCAIAIERFRQLTAKPDTAFFQVNFVCHIPNHCLPIRVEDQIAGVAEEFNPIAAWFEAVEEVSLRGSMLGRTTQAYFL